MSAISFNALNKIYPGKPPFHAIRDVDLHIEQGEFAVFVGPSGCGKSTLLRMVAGLEDISSGEISFDGAVVNDLTPRERRVGMVFQSYALYPHMSVYDNMAFGLKLARADRGSIQDRVERVAGILQIDHLLERKPEALSGGQRQRVAIGRAIVREPKVFLFDEPLSNLDAALRVQMRIEIARLHSQLGATMIYVTHDQAEAMTLADKIVVLDNGMLSQVGAPMTVYNEPANAFVAGFIGSPRMNFMPAALVPATDGGIEVDLRDGSSLIVPRQPGTAGEGQLGIRPEHLSLERGDDDLLIRGRVIVVEKLGNETLGYLETDVADEPVVLSLPGDHAIEAGENLEVFAPSAACHVFAATGEAQPRLRE